jgi:hypothetical protein
MGWFHFTKYILHNKTHQFNKQSLHQINQINKTKHRYNPFNITNKTHKIQVLQYTIKHRKLTPVVHLTILVTNNTMEYGRQCFLYFLTYACSEVIGFPTTLRYLVSQPVTLVGMFSQPWQVTINYIS